MRLPLSAMLCLLALSFGSPCPGQEGQVKTRVPRWDARGVGPLPWQGVASLDVNDDASLIAAGTIAPPGDPNVLLLDGNGRLLRQQHAGQRWINQVTLTGGDGEMLRAVCTMPAGRAGDQPELFRLGKEKVEPEAISWRRTGYADAYWHYGDHSNHVSRLLARSGDEAVLLNGDQVSWLGAGGKATATFPLAADAIPIALAADRQGFVVVGTTAAPSKSDTRPPNLHLLDRASGKPLWSRPLTTETGDAPRPEQGLYGTPTLPDGTRAELPQHDDKVWAPLAVAVHGEATKRLVAAADYQGWQRWVRSSATQHEENLGVRFLPSRPAVTVYDQDGKPVRSFGPESFAKPLWCDLQFLPDGKRLLAWPHHWTSRGLAGQSILPADEDAHTLYVLEVQTGKLVRVEFPDSISDLAVSDQGTVAAGCWDGRVYLLTGRDLAEGRLPAGVAVDGPSLVRVSRAGSRIVAAGTGGVVRLLDGAGKELWHNDLNQSVQHGLKPWVDGARATPLTAGLWQLPGGRVESDLGGQRVLEAPDGLILIEAHSGLSFESEWAAMKAVGLDPARVKYVLATHEHGDHAPGAYLWRVVTGARFVCSTEMAYTLQHHVPLGSGYGFSPPNPTDIKVSRDTDLDLAGQKVRAVRIPGHTFGSLAWQFGKGGKSYVAFGDLIMPKGVLGYSGSINFSARDVLASLRKLQDLKPDVVLPGHGAVEGPGNYLAAGVDVAVAGGWGLIRPEKPDPYFRIGQKNVIAVAWNSGAVSAAFGDIDGDGKPDVAVVRPDGDGSIVAVFLNRGGTFADRPDLEVRLPSVAAPHKVRVVPGKKGASAHLFVAGKSAALLEPDGKFPAYKVVALDMPDGNHLRSAGAGEQQQMLISRRFGAFEVLDRSRGKPQLMRFQPEVSGPYADLQTLDLNGDGRSDLVTSNGHVFLRGADGKLPAQPSLRLEVEKDDWTSLAVGDFNGDGRPDIALLSYGMHGQTAARVYYNTGKAERPFAAKPDALLPLNPAKKGEPFSLLRDSPVVADWDGDGIADLVVGRGQSQEVLVLLGGKAGLDVKRSRTVALDYRTHYETGLFVGDFNGDGVPDLAVFGYTLTGVGWSGPSAAYIWLQPAAEKKDGE
jgi:glyoxylase-like metal-dependent hydrolase (beta-lactamase superfamily II)/outer membrane protein assembly factor BamB